MILRELERTSWDWTRTNRFQMVLQFGGKWIGFHVSGKKKKVFANWEEKVVMKKEMDEGYGK